MLQVAEEKLNYIHEFRSKITSEDRAATLDNENFKKYEFIWIMNSIWNDLLMNSPCHDSHEFIYELKQVMNSCI